MKIVLAEKVSPATLAVFKEQPDWTVLTHDQLTKGLEAELADADALVVRSAVQVDAKLLEHAPKLRVIGRAGVGVDNIDAPAATARGIVVMNTPGANAVAVAELTLGMMIALARQVPKANATMHAGKWEKKSLQGVELKGKTLGIVGLGRVGMEVVRRALPFGMTVVGYDPFVAPAVARENNVELLPLDEVFKRSEYLSLHVGLTPQTEGLINATSIATMKKGVRIINAARGELVVDEALVAALQSGQVGGAALDVFRSEPLKESPYFALENVILSPHIAGSTNESQENVGIQIARQVSDYLKLGVVQNAVNAPSLSFEDYQLLSPYITMAEKLGRLMSGAAVGNLENVQFSYTGKLAAAKTDLVRNAALTGVMGDAEVNHINAATVAQERGIRMSEEKKDPVSGGAGSTLKVVLHTQSGDVTASATVLHGTSPRLLTWDGIDIEAPLQGTIIAIRNHDVPGVIGSIGTILGEHKVNIANFALGRSVRSQRVPQGQAIAVVQIDGTAANAAAAVAALRKVDAIASVRLVDLEHSHNEVEAQEEA